MKSALSTTACVPARPQRRSLEGRLHRLYHWGSGVRHFLSCRCRPAGIALGVVFILATCLGIGQQRSSLFQLFSFTLGMGMIGLPWAVSRRATVEAKRELPRFATAGDPLRYSVMVQHLGRGRLSRAWLADSPPDPRPSLADFTTLREPGEEERNRFDRRLAFFRWQWILLGNRLFSGGFSSDALNLKSGEQTRISIELIPLRRGLIRLEDLRILLPDPFGLFQRCRRVPAPPAVLTVLPRRFPLAAFELPGGSAYKISGEANTNTIGTSGEFVGLRDYRPGDPLRQIHWKSWARTGRPIVKELEDTFYPRYGLIVDTLATGRTDHAFEEVISVAASFAAAIDTNESLLDLMFIKNEAHIVTAGRGVERAEKLLEVLAEVSPERRENYADLAKLVIRHCDDLTSCLVILNGWDPLRAEFLQKLTRGGIVCAVIIVGQGPAPVGVAGHWLESGYVGRDLKRLPLRLIIHS